MAHAMRQVGLEAYHDKGDEFLCRGRDIGELLAKLERARSILRNHAAIVERLNESRLEIRGADFSHGVGKSIDDAERVLRRHKAERERAGEITRGELRSITVSLAFSAGLQTSNAVATSLKAAPSSLVLLP